MDVKRIQISDNNGNIYHPETTSDSVIFEEKKLTDEIKSIKDNIDKKANSVHTHTKSQITDMPTNLSQFNNDTKFITKNDVDTHTHSNKSILDTITQTLIDKWNSAYAHISDTVKHITSSERTLWNSVSNKVNKSGDTINGHITIVSDENPLSVERNGSANLSIKFENKTTNYSGVRYLGTYSGSSLRYGDKSDLSSAYEIYHTGKKPNKTDVGLGNVDNTSDLNKPISNATQTALNGKSNTNHTHNYAGSSSAGGSANSSLVCTGNSATATKLATARTITLSGNVTGSANFDGSGNITINTSGISSIPTSTITALF